MSHFYTTEYHDNGFWWIVDEDGYEVGVGHDLKKDAVAATRALNADERDAAKRAAKRK